MCALPKLDSKNQLLQSKSEDLDCLSQCTDPRAAEKKRMEVEENGSHCCPPSR